jgi:hypothetical protein
VDGRNASDGVRDLSGVGVLRFAQNDPSETTATATAEATAKTTAKATAKATATATAEATAKAKSPHLLTAADVGHL